MRMSPIILGVLFVAGGALAAFGNGDVAMLVRAALAAGDVGK